MVKDLSHMSGAYFTSCQQSVGEDWLDANEHMNVSSYDRVFDQAEMLFFEEFGIDPASIRDTRFTAFRLEKTVMYEHETMLGDKIEVRSRVIWTDFRRVHHFHELMNLTRNTRSACVDAISIFVDLNVRKSVEISSSEGRTALERYFEFTRTSGAPAGVLTRTNGRRA